MEFILDQSINAWPSAHKHQLILVSHLFTDLQFWSKMFYQTY